MNHGTIGRLVGLVALAAAVASCGGGRTTWTSTSAGSASTVGDPGVVATDVRIGRQPPPHGFHAYSLSFISVSEGWALGQARCARRQCAYVLHTADGGRSWATTGRVPAQIAENNGTCMGEQSDCVGQIVFVSQLVGFAFQPSLLVTHDGGRSWRRTVGTQVDEVVASGATALRVASAGSCWGGCHLQRSVDAGISWSDVLGAPVVRDAGVYVRVADESRLYLVGGSNPAGGAWDKHAILYRSADGGHTWELFADPCGDRRFTLDLVALPDDAVVVLCDDQSNGSDDTSVMVSPDGGRHFGTPRAVPGAFPVPFAAGGPSALAATVFPPGVETTQDGGEHWQITIKNCSAGVPTPWYPDGEASSLGFVTPSVAHVLCPSDRLWTTNDGGEHWEASSFHE